MAAGPTLTSKGACPLPLQASMALVAANQLPTLLLPVQPLQCCCCCIARAMPCTQQPSCIVQHTALTTHGQTANRSPPALLCLLHRWQQTRSHRSAPSLHFGVGCHSTSTCNAVPAAQVAADMDLSTKLPSEAPGRAARMVVATLDVNTGLSIPAEELCGTKPQVRCCAALMH